jgi:hypothetical protein
VGSFTRWTRIFPCVVAGSVTIQVGCPSLAVFAIMAVQVERGRGQDVQCGPYSPLLVGVSRIPVLAISDIAKGCTYDLPVPFSFLCRTLASFRTSGQKVSRTLLPMTAKALRPTVSRYGDIRFVLHQPGIVCLQRGDRTVHVGWKLDGDDRR